jgi:hypothetical protein
MEQNMMLIGIVILALLVVGAWMLMRKRQSEHLEKSFGPEYQRALDEHGSRTKAEAELLARKKRVGKMHLQRLAPERAARFADEWRTLQARFVDNPKGVLMQADRLVSELMLQRGYPMGDFESRAADISVDHPAVVHHYRSARDIGLRDERGEADTEALRQAVVHYRALFSELLEVEEAHEPIPERSHGILHRMPKAERTDKQPMERHQ